MKIDLSINSPEFPGINVMTIDMSDNQKEVFPMVIRAMIAMNWISQDILRDSYRGSDNDVVVYRKKI